MEPLMSHDRGLFVIGNREFTFRALGPPTVTCIVDVFCTCSMTFVTRYVHPHKCNYVRQIIHVLKLADTLYLLPFMLASTVTAVSFACLIWPHPSCVFVVIQI